MADTTTPETPEVQAPVETTNEDTQQPLETFASEQQPEEEAEVPPARKIVKVLDKEYDFDPDFPDDKIARFKDFSENLYKDYQKKTNSVAEERRQIEAARAAIAEEFKFAQEYRSELGNLTAIENQLAEWSAITPEQWGQYADSDPTGAQKAWLQYQALQNKKAAVEKSFTEKQRALQAKQAEQQSTQQQRVSEYIARGQQYLKEKIADWGEAKQKALVDAGKEYGFTQEELASTIDPRAVMLLHDAYLYRQSVRKAVKESEPPAAKPQPGAKVGVAASAAKDPDNMSMTDWMKWREGELRKKGRLK